MLQRIVRVWSTTTGRTQDTPEGIVTSVRRAPRAQSFSQFPTINPGVRRLALIDLPLQSYDLVASGIWLLGCQHWTGSFSLRDFSSAEYKLVQKAASRDSFTTVNLFYFFHFKQGESRRS